MHSLQVPAFGTAGVSVQVLQFVNVDSILVHTVIEEEKFVIIEVYSLFIEITMQYIHVQSSAVAEAPEVP